MRLPSHVPALALLLTGGWLATASADPEKRAEPSIERGREAFRSYCSSCHGIRGGGDGPLAEVLKTPPADLTLLKNKNGGEFPKAKTEKIIDGRDPSFTRVHGVTDMPVWGERLSLEVSGSAGKKEDHVRRRIGFIVRYLESIQAPAPATAPAPTK